MEAAKRLKSLVWNTATNTGKRVRLTALDGSTSNLGRPSRFVAVQDAEGRWEDVGTILTREGLVIPSYQRVNYTYNEAYRKLAEAAAAKGIGMWDKSYCGAGPVADLAVHVNWDAPGDDAVNVNGEYVKITNKGSSAVDLANWWVRDSATRQSATKEQTRRGFIFPAGASVGAGESIYVHPGKAPASPKAGNYYWGLSAPIFENVTTAPTYMGDGGYLFDPQGDLRNWEQYPCVDPAPHACIG